MAFWKVAGFAQPSPIEQILDKENYTLEELLDEDDIIQECKSLNGRLIAFLREKSTVEKLLKYLVSPPTDTDDPKKQYKYPFTACEVFCCEVEAIFNTLLDDDNLLQLLFSLLDQPPPLSCKTAGYFGRVVGQLLLRKTNEMMQYMSNNESILERFIRQVDTTSIADVLKRLVGADDQSSMLFLPMHTQWLTETPLVDMLLARLGPEYSSDVQANAADILTAIAHTQPSFLATQLMQPKAIASLFQRALGPGSKVLVAALDVCAALLEPLRSQQDQAADGSPGMGSSAGGSMSKPRADAVATMLKYVPQLVEHIRTPADAAATQETPHGLLAPPLGRARLKAIELLAALLRVGDEAADDALISTNAIPLVMVLFAQYPFNNLLHHQMVELLLAALRRANPRMIEHLFGPSCSLLQWLQDVPKEVVPQPRPGGTTKGPLRAGYLGHVTRMSNILVEVGQAKASVGEKLVADSLWASYVSGDLLSRNEQEDVNLWACGRPSNMELNALDSDGDDFQNDMELEQMQGIQPGIYHRYGVLDDNDDDDDDEEEQRARERRDKFMMEPEYSTGAYSRALVAAMANMGIQDNNGSSSSSPDEAQQEGEQQGGQGGQGIGNWSLLAHPGTSSPAMDIPGTAGIEDDAVLLAGSDDEDIASSSFLPPSNNLLPVPNSAGPYDAGEGDTEPAAAVGGVAASPPGDDLVLVDEAEAVLSCSPGMEVAGPSQMDIELGSSPAQVEASQQGTLEGEKAAAEDIAVTTTDRLDPFQGQPASEEAATAALAAAAAVPSPAAAGSQGEGEGQTAGTAGEVEKKPAAVVAPGDAGPFGAVGGGSKDIKPPGALDSSKYWTASFPVQVDDEI